MFTDKDFAAAKRKLRLPLNPPDPTYKLAMDACANAKEMGEADRIRKHKWKLKKDNVIDHLYFNVVREHNVQTLSMVEELLKKEVSDDNALQYPYLYERERKTMAIDHELKRLVKSFQEIVREWSRGMMKAGDQNNADNYNATVDKCYRMFRSLLPEHTQTPEVKSWMEPYLYSDFRRWETLRASALYAEYPRKSAFVFHMAGKELADLKSCPPSRNTRSVCSYIFTTLRPRVTKVMKSLDGAVESDDEDFMTPLEEVA
jgi:hypothetical protein